MSLPKFNMPKLGGAKLGSAPKVPKVDFKQIVEEFKTLDPKDPGMWPLAPRILVLLFLFLALVGLSWWIGWRVQLEELGAKEQQENQLKEEWLNKKKQAVNLDEYRRQLAEIDRSFGVLLKQLPNKSEMEALLVDVNQAGLGRGLQFELFKPGTESVKEFYAELPITVKLTGSYHDLGAFAGDVAKMPRIVTLNDIDVTLAPNASKTGPPMLALSTVAKTFRYLDAEEIAKQKKAARDKAAGAKK